jgi:hypothetical protein
MAEKYRLAGEFNTLENLARLPLSEADYVSIYRKK